MMPKKILIVDDLIFACKLIESFIDGRQYTILTAASGKEALEVAKRKMPDLIIMDLYMPEMKGDETCRIIKSDPELSQIPVIMKTSSWLPEEEERCNKAGCDDFILKPYKTTVLLEKLSKHLPLVERKEPRFSINEDVCLQLHYGLAIGKALNISLSGICIETTAPITVGKETDLALSIPKYDINIHTKVKSVRTLEFKNENSINSRWQTGFKFNEIPFDLKEGLCKLAAA